MGYKTFCDICDSEVVDGGYSTRGNYEHKYYCEKCWLDKKTWPKIHEVHKTDTN